jgi:DNA-binding CsgD family transcriptional regulator/PAS domain-containing protein
MCDSEQLSNLIADIYDTVLDRSLWPVALKNVTGFVRGEASAIFWRDAASNRGDVFFDDGGIAPDYKRLYFEKYVALDPTATIRFFPETGEPTATADLLPYDEFLQTRFFREWAKPQGLVDFVSAFLEKTGPRAAIFGVFRHERQGLVDAETRERMRLVTPHIRQAVLISKGVDRKQDEVASLAQVFEGLRAGVILVDPEGRVVHANAAAHTLLGEGRVLRVSCGRLATGDAKTNSDLREIFAAAARHDSAVGTSAISLPATSEVPESYVAHVLPLVAGKRRHAAARHTATAAMFVRKTAFETVSPPNFMAETFKLTMTELRVLFAIVDVGGVPEVAQVLGIARSTVRTHLSRIYEKTGVARQLDLVKLVAGYVSPLSA